MAITSKKEWKNEFIKVMAKELNEFVPPNFKWNASAEDYFSKRCEGLPPEKWETPSTAFKNICDEVML